MTWTSHKSGYIVSSLRNLVCESQDKAKLNCLLQLLSNFQLKNCSLSDTPEAKTLDPILAVLHNQLVRGTPTIPSLYTEEVFSESLKWTTRNVDKRTGEISFPMDRDIQEQIEVHLPALLSPVDPQFILVDYHFDVLDINSRGEHEFIRSLYHEAGTELAQLMEPQAEVEKLIASQGNQFREQQVDFAFNNPILSKNKEGEPFRKGIIVEIDGAQHHLLEEQHLLDEKRDQEFLNCNWHTHRIGTQRISDGVPLVTEALLSTSYGKLVQRFGDFFNDENPLHQKCLQFVLSPFAIARAEWTLLRFLMNQEGWRERREPFKVAFIERDIPGALVAVNDLTEKINRMLNLAPEGESFCGFAVQSFCPDYYSRWELHRAFSDQVRPLEDFQITDGYDLVVDLSVLRRAGIEKAALFPQAIEEKPTIAVVRSSFAPDTPRFNAQYNWKKHRILSAKPIVYKPAVKLDERGHFEPIDDVRADLKYFLNNIFRKLDFRDGQLPILSRALQRKNVIGLLPTGGGKSLTYQLAAFLQPGVTMVIDPIKSLMQDQYEGLQRMAIDAVGFINSSQNSSEKRIAESYLRSGAWMFCFISPERLVIKDFRKNVLRIMADEELYCSYAVIDEVHCVSEWGHDFRTPYLNLGANCSTHCCTLDNSDIPLLGLTATASFDVLADVERELFVDPEQEADALVRFENTNRPELQFCVIDISDRIEYEKDEGFWNGQFEDMPFPLKEHGSYGNKFIKDQSGQFRQDFAKELLGVGNESFARHLEQYNTTERIKEVLDHEAAEYLQELPPISIKSFKRQYEEWMQLNGGNWQVLHDVSDAGALIFTPHTKGYFGVTGQYEEKWIEGDNQWVPNPNMDGVADALRSAGFNAVGTFRGTSNVRRIVGEKIEKESQLNQHKFVNSTLSVMVATKAFGMGIDKSNIRTTVHLSMPGSLESLVQESGRAGRDRRLALSFILVERDPFIHFLPEGVQWLKQRPQELEKLSFEGWSQLLNPHLGSYISNRYFRCKDLNATNSDIQNFKKDIDRLKSFQKPKVIEEISLDRDILEYFHYNSYKGETKEKVVVKSLLESVSTPWLSILYQRVLEELGDNEPSFSLNARSYETGDKLFINRGPNQPYHGYIRLTKTAHGYGEIAAGADSAIVKEVWTQLQHIPIEGNPVHFLKHHKQQCDGILDVLKEVPQGNKFSLTIPVENLIENAAHKIFVALHKYSLRIKENAIRKIYGKASTFSEFLSQVESKANQNNLSNNKPLQFLTSIFIKADEQNDREKGSSRAMLEKYFSGVRVESDTFKAIYRMMCIGLITDYTIDYNANTVKVELASEPKEYYMKMLQEYYQRYLSEKLAMKQISPVEEFANNATREKVIIKCLKDVIAFAYEQVAQKRLLAIQDVEEAVNEALRKEDNFHGSRAFKDFIHTYFNSKYARKRNKPASLVDDLEKLEEKDSLELAYKYMKVPLNDETGPTITNLKHLRGASQRLIRSSNHKAASLHLIKAFTLVVLASKNKNSLKDAWHELNAFLSLARDSGLVSSASELQDVIEKIKISVYKYVEGMPELEKYLALFDDMMMQWFFTWFKEFSERYTS